MNLTNEQKERINSALKEIIGDENAEIKIVEMSEEERNMRVCFDVLCATAKNDFSVELADVLATIENVLQKCKREIRETNNGATLQEYANDIENCINKVIEDSCYKVTITVK